MENKSRSVNYFDFVSNPSFFIFVKLIRIARTIERRELVWAILKLVFENHFSFMENMILCEGLKNNYNNNNPGRGGTGGSGKVKSCKDHDGAQGWELSRPTT